MAKIITMSYHVQIVWPLVVSFCPCEILWKQNEDREPSNIVFKTVNVRDGELMRRKEYDYPVQKSCMFEGPMPYMTCILFTREGKAFVHYKQL